MRRVAVLAGLVAVRAAAARQARADRGGAFRLGVFSRDPRGRRGAGVGARRGEAQTEEPEEAHSVRLPVGGACHRNFFMCPQINLWRPGERSLRVAGRVNLCGL